MPWLIRLNCDGKFWVNSAEGSKGPSLEGGAQRTANGGGRAEGGACLIESALPQLRGTAVGEDHGEGNTRGWGETEWAIANHEGEGVCCLIESKLPLEDEDHVEEEACLTGPDEGGNVIILGPGEGVGIKVWS